MTGLRVVEEEAGGREEVDDDNVLRRSLADVPDAGVLLVAGRLVVLVVIRFESPFWAVFLLSSPDVSDRLPSVSEAAVLEEAVVGRRVVEDAEGRVGGLLRPPPNAARDVIDGVFEEAIGDRVAAVDGLAAVDPASRFGAAGAVGRLAGGTFSTPFLGATGEATGEDSAADASEASAAIGVLS